MDVMQIANGIPMWIAGSTRSDSGCSFCERGVRCRKEDGTW